MKISKFILILAALLSAVFTLTLHAQTSAFTYQGRLQDHGSPANGTYDLQFTIYDADTGGSVVAGPLTNSLVAVTNGLFTTTLDFGAGLFDGSDRWLEIGVATNGSGGFTNLSPRQFITSAPYAIQAATAMDLRNGSVRNPSFIGTTTGTPLTLFANNQTALRLASPSGGTPDLIAGGAGNSIDPLAAASTIAGGGIPGFPNSVAAKTSFIGAGNSNSITAPLADSDNDFIGAGYGNSIEGEACFIGSGNYNTIQTNAWWSVISGGRGHVIGTNAPDSTISGGSYNTIAASSYDGAIGGGARNTIQVTGNYGTIGGGRLNTNGGLASVISGGRGHVIGTNAPDSTISGGYYNTVEANSYDGAIGGGAQNTIQRTGNYSTIGGGRLNTNAGPISVIGGGRYNSIGPAADDSVIGGGYSNRITGSAMLPVRCVIAGGSANSIQTNVSYSTISGGLGNLIEDSVSLSTIGGGSNNLVQSRAVSAVISGGVGNTIGSNALYATIPGGADNVAGGQYSLAAGWNAEATNNSCFVWSDGSTNTFSTTNNQFVVRAGGGFVFYSDTAGTGVLLAPGSGSWSTLSDRDAKDDFARVNPERVLARVASLPMTIWSYKTEQGVRHIGPMAQDFYTAFKVGEDERHIADVDEGGVALAAIQGLNQKMETRDQRSAVRIQKLETENAELKRQLNQLVRTVNKLSRKIHGGAR